MSYFKLTKSEEAFDVNQWLDKARELSRAKDYWPNFLKFLNTKNEGDIFNYMDYVEMTKLDKHQICNHVSILRRGGYLERITDDMFDTRFRIVKMPPKNLKTK